jgi:hypothetical protein
MIGIAHAISNLVDPFPRLVPGSIGDDHACRLLVKTEWDTPSQRPLSSDTSNHDRPADPGSHLIEGLGEAGRHFEEMAGLLDRGDLPLVIITRL